MKTTTRFLTGSLAALAVASTVTLTGSSAYGAEGPDRSCGQPAVPAVYMSASAVLHRLPALTHDAWLWQHDVTTVEREYTRILTPAGTKTVDQTREVDGITEYLWSHNVVTQAAVPAVLGTPEVSHQETVVVTAAVTVSEFEYVQKEHPEMTRWEADGWNGEKGDVDKGRGWTKTGNTRVTELSPQVTTQQKVVTQAATGGTPAVPEVWHLVETWASAPGDDGWTRVQHVVPVPEVVDTVWAFVAPVDHTPTGSFEEHTTTEQTDVVSAGAPAGAGWTQVPGSLVVVVDREATTEVVEPAGPPVLVTPAMPASPDCPVVAPATVAPVVSSPVETKVEGPSTTATQVAGPSAVHAAAASHVAAPSHAVTTLPNTGNPVSPLLLGTGLGALLAGGALVQVSRRRHPR